MRLAMMTLMVAINGRLAPSLKCSSRMVATLINLWERLKT
jgi:hypothetical protein